MKRRERENYLRRKYGIDLEHYDAMLASQHGVCAIWTASSGSGPSRW